MKIRTQLVLACFLLSVLPLTGIVLYSYHSSRKALESAYRQEGQRLARQMDRRLTTIRAELDERLASLSSLTLAGGEGSAARSTVESIVTVMGDAASLIDTLEYIPAPAAAVAMVDPVSAPAPAAAPAPRVAKRLSSPPPLHDAVEAEWAQSGTDEGSETHAAHEAIVIDLPPAAMPHFEMSPLAHASMSEIARLSGELEHAADKMSREERESVKKVIREKSKILEREIESSRARFQTDMKEAQRAAGERRRMIAEDRERRRVERTSPRPQRASAPPTPQVAPAPAAPAAPAAPRVRATSDLSVAERARMQATEKRARLIFGRSFNVPVEKEGAVVGQLRAQLSTDEVIRRVLGGQGGDRDEVPFAIDREGNIYTRNAIERSTLNGLGIPQRVRKNQPLGGIEGWIVVSSSDEDSGLRVGVARPVGENFVELKQTAARNFGYGVGLIAFALVGMIPLANHFTRDVKRVTEGAERIAQGDLQTRLPVKSKDEFGQLALAFNQMAEDLSENQRRLFTEERTRREQEVQQRVLAIEYERKTDELEDARRFQLSMLPKEVPVHKRYEVGVFTKTATEVGGDYYDFQSGERSLCATIGDATGHGAKAGTMVTVIKTLFAGYNGDSSPGAFLGDAAERIKRMDLGRMAMALSLARFDGSTVTVSSAGMPPMLIHRARSGEVEEVALPATPLGTLGVEYAEKTYTMDPGDTVLLMTDGFPELLNAAGQQLGYPRATEEFSRAAAAPDAKGVIDAMASAARQWHGDHPPNDDITFVVVRAIG